MHYNMLYCSIAPASPPANVRATVRSSTEVLVAWDSVPPTDQNGVITMYEVLYQPLQMLNARGLVETTRMSVVLMDLQEFVMYNISVRAYTSVGEPGPFSEALSVTTPQDGKSTILGLHTCSQVSDGLTFEYSDHSNHLWAIQSGLLGGSLYTEAT